MSGKAGLADSPAGTADPDGTANDAGRSRSSASLGTDEAGKLASAGNAWMPGTPAVFKVSLDGALGTASWGWPGNAANSSLASRAITSGSGKPSTRGPVVAE